ncbi:unnamed protein product [Calypogeia fissa]
MSASNHGTLWCRGDNYHVDIPDAERNAITTVGTGSSRSSRRSKAMEKVPNLNGKTAEEVEAEAARICLGQQFDNFDEFDRCMDSWAVIHGRIVARLKTQLTHCVRVCRFGKIIKKIYKKTSDKEPGGTDANRLEQEPGGNGADNSILKRDDYQLDHHDTSDEDEAPFEWHFENGEWTGDSRPIGKENVQCYVEPIASQEQVFSLLAAPSI